MLAAVISNMSGKSLKRSVRESVFLPRYAGEAPAPVREKSLDEQRADFRAFAAKLGAVRPDWVHKKVQ